MSLPNPAATEALARGLSALARDGDVLALHGALGTGKTTFARAFIRARIADPLADVPSPTFTLVQTYGTPESPGEWIWHFDLYRIEDQEEVWELGMEEAFAAGIVVIEWPERMGGYLPAERLDVELTHDRGDGRRALLRGHGEWEDRIRAFVAQGGIDE